MKTHKGGIQMLLKSKTTEGYSLGVISRDFFNLIRLEPQQVSYWRKELRERSHQKKMA